MSDGLTSEILIKTLQNLQGSRDKDLEGLSHEWSDLSRLTCETVLSWLLTDSQPKFTLTLETDSLFISRSIHDLGLPGLFATSMNGK